MSSKLFYLTILFLVGISLREISSIPLSVFNLDESKKAVITEFRSLIEGFLPHEYMKEDNYLLRFLASRNFDLKEATNYLKENLVWRELDKIDSILEEDWSDFDKRFPYQLSSVTKDGCPLLYYNYGKWDIQGLIASDDDLLSFYRYKGAKMLEDADRKVRETRKGSNDIAQFDVLINMDGYTKEKQGCMQCVQLMKEILQMSEARYSGAFRNIFFVNSPPEFQQNVFPILTVSLQEDTRESMTVLGERTSWEPVLLNYVAKEELPQELQA